MVVVLKINQSNSKFRRNSNFYALIYFFIAIPLVKKYLERKFFAVTQEVFFGRYQMGIMECTISKFI